MPTILIMTSPIVKNLESILSIESLSSELEFEYDVLVDNGMGGIADPSDIFQHKETGLILPGYSAIITMALDERLQLLQPAAAHYWLDRAQQFWTGDSVCQPSREEILNWKSSPLRIPKPTNEQGWLKNMVGEIKAVAVKSGFDVEDVPFKTSYFLQDIFVPFSDGQIIGVPPQFNEDRLYELYADMYNIYGEFPTGGASFKKGCSDATIDSFSQTHKIRHFASFIEGGNIIFAYNKNGAFRAILGEEALHYTETFYNVSRDEALALVARDLNLTAHQIVVVPQVDYHIDLHIRGNRGGHIFLANHSSGYSMLYSLIEENRRKGYSTDDLEELQRRVTISRSSAAGKLQEQRLGETRAILKKAGFIVEDYPSIYYSPKLFPDSYVAINTINNRYVTTRGEKGLRTINLVLRSGYNQIDKYIKEYEISRGTDEIHFIAGLSAEPMAFGSKIIGRLKAGLGCFTNF